MIVCIKKKFIRKIKKAQEKVNTNQPDHVSNVSMTPQELPSSVVILSPRWSGQLCLLDLV